MTRRHFRNLLLEGYAKGIALISGDSGYSAIPLAAFLGSGYSLPEDNTDPLSHYAYHGSEIVRNIGCVAALANLDGWNSYRASAQRYLDRFLEQVPGIKNIMNQDLDVCKHTADYVAGLGPGGASKKYSNWMGRHFGGGINLIGTMYSGETSYRMPDGHMEKLPEMANLRRSDENSGFQRLAEVEQEIKDRYHVAVNASIKAPAVRIPTATMNVPVETREKRTGLVGRLFGRR